MNANGNTSRYRLFRLHQGPANAVHYETESIVAASDLATWFVQRFPNEEAAAHIVAADVARASAGAELVDVYVPLPERRYRRRTAEWLAAASAYRVAPGTALLHTVAPHAHAHRYGYAETLLALACSGAPISANIVFHHRHGDATATDLQGLCKRYGVPLPAVSGTQKAEFTVRMPAESLAAWLDAPPLATNAFHETFLQISGHIQTILRAWLRYEWPSDLTRFDDLVASRAMIMYWLSTPHRGNSRAEFTYDVFSVESASKLCRVGANRYGAELDRIGERLTAAGRLAAAHCYRSIHTREIMAAVRRQRRTVARFIAVESEIMDALINFSVRIKSQNGLRDLAEAAADTLHTMRSTLRRLPVTGWEHDLAVLVLIEATSALRIAMGLNSTVEATLHLSTAENKAAA